jgi:hypothetical protein
LEASEVAIPHGAREEAEAATADVAQPRAMVGGQLEVLRIEREERFFAPRLARAPARRRIGLRELVELGLDAPGYRASTSS